MNKYLIIILILLNIPFPVLSDPLELDSKPMTMYLDWEQGQIVNGFFEDTEVKGPYTPKGDLVFRSGLWLSKEASYQERTVFRAGVGGLFFNLIPEASDRFARGLRFAAGISEASVTHIIGNVESPALKIQFGYFPVKYNDQASNLGEYLYRSIAYPGILRTGDWTSVNSAFYQAMGTRIHFSTFSGILEHEIALYMDKEYAPFFDFTPSYLGTFNFGKSIQFGFGLAWSHALSFKPSRLSPGTSSNTYITVENHPGVAAPIFENVDPETQERDTIFLSPIAPNQVITAPVDWFKQLKDTVTGADGILSEELAWDTTGTVLVTKNDPSADPLSSIKGTGVYRYATKTGQYTHRGIKGIARLNVDIKTLFGLKNFENKNDMKIYMETALLGFASQPFYYEKTSERMPFMIGFNFPTWGLLDLLSFQWEYYSSPYNQSIEKITLQTGIPVPGDSENFGRFMTKDDEKDNVKWSLLMKKSLTPWFQILTQVANDHMRTKTFAFIDENYPALNDADHWYYLAKAVFHFN